MSEVAERHQRPEPGPPGPARDTEVYGSTTHDDLVALIESVKPSRLGLKAVVRQSDSEAELLDWIHARPMPANRWCSTPGR